MQNSWVEPGLSPLEIPMTRAIIPNINRLAAALGCVDTMVSAAMTTRTDEEHDATLIIVMQLVADVRSTDDVLGPLQPHMA